MLNLSNSIGYNTINQYKNNATSKKQISTKYNSHDYVPDTGNFRFSIL